MILFIFQILYKARQADHRVVAKIDGNAVVKCRYQQLDVRKEVMVLSCACNSSPAKMSSHSLRAT